VTEDKENDETSRYARSSLGFKLNTLSRGVELSSRSSVGLVLSCLAICLASKKNQQGRYVNGDKLVCSRGRRDEGADRPWQSASPHVTGRLRKM
jgi:hypothetical protein